MLEVWSQSLVGREVRKQSSKGWWKGDQAVARVAKGLLGSCTGAVQIATKPFVAL